MTEKTDELKTALVQMYERREWDKWVSIGGEKYRYCSAYNEFRRLVHQTGEDISVLVGCMAFGKFMWCC